MVAAEHRRRNGKVERMVGVDRLHVAGRIVVDEFGIDADRGQRLLQIVAELLRLVEIGRRQQLQLEARSVGAGLVAGLVEQRLSTSNG